jgi:glycine/D-amino acid oxidase-like deaminating enzyme
METARIVIVGAGICGAATAYFLALSGETDVVVLEAEGALNVHSSGRSASYFVPMYETGLFATLAQRAEPFLASPPDGFAAHPLLDRRGAILAADEATLPTHEAETATARALGIPVETIEPSRIPELIPIAQPRTIVAASWYPGAGAIDSHALSMAYVAAAKRAGVRFALERRFVGAARNGRRVVAALTNAGPIGCEVIVDAAGAWAGEVAWRAGAAPIFVAPKRRHVIGIALPPEHARARWPFFRAPSIPLYFRPEAGQLLASAMDAELIAACDCPTDETAIATVAAAVTKNTTLTFDRIATSWAGLRVFSPDGAPLVGWDLALHGFMWVAAAGGTGIQSSPAVGRIAADLLLGRGVRDETTAAMDPARFAGMRKSPG